MELTQATPHDGQPHQMETTLDLVRARAAQDAVAKPWPSRKFAEIAQFRNGLNFVKSDNGDRVKIVGVADFQRNFRVSYDQLEIARIAGALCDDDLLKDGDLLFVRSNGNKALIGRCIIIDRLNETVSHSGFTIRARIVDPTVSPEFVGLYFQSSMAKAQIHDSGEGSHISNLSQGVLASLELPLPSIAEQEAIAEALSDADAYIESLERLIAKKRRVKQGAMQELLTGQRRLPGFEVQPGHKTTEIGVIPEDWDTCPLGQVGKWLSGGTPSMSNPAYWDGDIPWISAKDMKVSRLHDSQDHIARKAVTDGARLVPPGTVLMVIRGMILAHTFPVARAECPLAFNQDLKAVVAADQIDSTYLLFWLMGNAQFFLGLTTESTHGTKRLPPGAFFRVPFPLPTKVEQAAIAAVISDMDAEITTLETRLAKARDVKQGMMQELLTGRVRLV